MEIFGQAITSFLWALVKPVKIIISSSGKNHLSSRYFIHSSSSVTFRQWAEPNHFFHATLYTLEGLLKLQDGIYNVSKISANPWLCLSIPI